MLRSPMLKALAQRSVINSIAASSSSSSSTPGQLPVLGVKEAKRKEVSEILEGEKKTGLVNTLTDIDNVMDIAGIPEEYMEERRVRIFKPARNAEQSGWNNTKAWKIELDNQQRWENPLIGWSSNSDALSNISLQLNFASKEDAIALCIKNRWPYTVEEPQERQIKPKAYGSNFHWSKRSRVGTK